MLAIYGKDDLPFVPMKRTIIPGPALRDLREAAGLTLGEVAHAAGVSQAYLSKVERGAHTPKPRWIARVLFALSRHMEASAERADQRDAA
ncbi:helix-turn-helix domain-containing protein [Prescottella equi]|uniref:helix-turn-helix domain-containing protein n=1 Tax=Rhodococcus hoagii TaxID=43767 RepID=UPI00330713F6